MANLTDVRLIEKARQLPVPAESGKYDQSYIAQVKDILSEAGLGNLANPASWGEQARLAAEGRTAEHVKGMWERIKAEEKAERGEAPKQGALAGVPVALPALTRALKLQNKAGAVGFDWNDPRAVLAKIREEADEIEAALDAGERAESAAEVGDLLFAVVNLARHLRADPEDLLQFKGEFGVDGQPFRKDLPLRFVTLAGHFINMVSGENALDGHLVLGQRAGLIGADDGGAAERLDRGQLPDEHVASDHALDAEGQGDGDDGGKAFTGVNRAAKGSSMASHSTGDVVIWLQHDITIAYGESALGALDAAGGNRAHGADDVVDRVNRLPAPLRLLQRHEAPRA